MPSRCSTSEEVGDGWTPDDGVASVTEAQAGLPWPHCGRSGTLMDHFSHHADTPQSASILTIELLLIQEIEGNNNKFSLVKPFSAFSLQNKDNINTNNLTYYYYYYYIINMIINQ